ncbi:MAG TPA: glycosyltransferase family 39 protein, partial [Chloroflexota bacterium]|nr:glycosyltransferase family 39 protein [Chloroflexota bacterium]
MALVAILLLAAALRIWQLGALPPGLNHDEGVNALDVERIIGGWHPIFLPANNGREALFMYSQAIVGAVLGVSPATLRLTAALWGILTVALTFGLGRRWYGSRVGLLAAGLLAVAFWHVVLSRVGLRAISAPAFYVAVLWALGEALQRRRRRAFVLAGVLLGLSEYTYISARVLPAILLVVCVLILLQEHRRRRPIKPLFLQLCLAAAAAVLTVLPEAYYFYRHPEMLIGRTDQVLVFSSHPAIIGTPISFQQSLQRTFGMFLVAGDRNWLHNIAGLPVLDPVLAVTFLVGVVVVCREWRRPVAGSAFTPPGRSDRAAVADPPVALRPGLWLAAWSGALLAGSSVTQESPNYLRLSALMPAVALLCAVGLATLGSFLTRWLAKRGTPRAEQLVAVLATALILGESVRTAQLYFGDWGRQGGVYTAFDTDIRDAAMASLRQSGVPVTDTFIQLDASAPYLFFRPQTSAAHWLREYSTVVALPPPGQPALWVYSHFQATPPLPGSLPTATLVARGDAHPGHPGYFLYRMTAQGLTAYRAGFRSLPQPITFGASLQLIATQWQGSTSLRPSTSATVLLLWRVLQPATANFGVSIHLTDAHGISWLQADEQGMMRDGWQ